MFANTLKFGTALSAGLLIFVATDPALTGATAQAAQVHYQAARPVARAAPRVNVQRSTVVRTNRAVVRSRSTTVKQLNVRRSTTTLKSNKLGVNPAIGRQLAPGVSKAVVSPGALRLGPGGAARLGPGPAMATRSLSSITLANRAWPIHRGPHRIWWGGGWRTFVPFAALSAVVVGGVYYWPAAYVSVARPYCAGLTPEGCQLNWQMVGFEGGGSEWQCVQFCPRAGVAPPPQAVALVPPPAAPPSGRCEMTVFAEPGFGGLSAPTSEDQPRLAENGWKDQIASVQVKAGTWDFFSGDEFGGESMRLAPGPYPQLGPDWTRHIGSFMCVQGN